MRQEGLDLARRPTMTGVDGEDQRAEGVRVELVVGDQLLQLAACGSQSAIAVTVLKLEKRGTVLPRLRLGGAL